ncbi:MAG: PAS domain S-box protein [Candidatus Electrothrix sp. ATG1]|nr:PAS domain S-box protein [Candidatus Electrothrix sp. ATG1]
MKIQNKAALIMTLFGTSLVILLSWGYEILNQRTVLESEQEKLINISEQIALHAESHLKEKVALALTLATSPLLKDALLKSNNEFSMFSEAKRKEVIDTRNQLWIEANSNSPFVQEYMSNPAAEYFKQQQNLMPGMYGEIFLTNIYGAMIASTGKLTTLAHAHKYWWKESYHEGQGRVFLDDRGFDDSVQGYVLGVVVPVKNKKETIGILKCNVNILSQLTDIVIEYSRNNPGIIRIVRSGGQIVREQGVEPLSTEIQPQLRDVLNTKQTGFLTIADKDKEQLAAFSLIAITYDSEKIAFGGSPQSIDHVKGNKGEAWHIVVSLYKDEALRSAHKTTKLIIFFGAVFTLLSAAMALVLGRLAARPIISISKTAQLIGAGNLNVRNYVTSNDEIGSLAESLNTMAKNLDAVTVSRDHLSKEIERRREIEKKLHQFKFTLDQTLDCVFMFSPDTLKFFYVNKGAINHLGFQEKDFFHMTPLNIKPAFTEETFRDLLTPLLEGRKKSHIFETVHKHKNGTLIPVEIFLQLVKQPTEKNGRFLAIVRDVSERIKSRQRLQKVMDTVEAMIYVTDINTFEILLTNQYTKEHFGDITGRKCWEALQEQSGPCSFCEYYSLRKAGQPITRAHVWQVRNFRDGEWYECRDQEIQWVDGRTARLQVATNITDRKKNDDEREQLIKKLQSALSEIQVLRGILPICSFCKNIRNDKGYYEHIESYIHKRSGVDFSHTVCPDCMKKHYPEEYKYLSAKNDSDSS